MLILALDTTTRAGSAAVLRDQTVLHVRSGDPGQTHGQRLPTELMRVLDEAGVRLDQIELFAVAAGPGSFTGLRVGIATIQALALARERRVVPVSVLDALARAVTVRPSEEAPGEDDYIAAWMDAQRGEVFAALYEQDGRTLVTDPTASPPEATLESWLPYVRSGASLWFAGDGALRYRELLQGRLAERARVLDELPALAGLIGAIASERAEHAVRPHAIVPIYVRRPDAELARARRARR